MKQLMARFLQWAGYNFGQGFHSQPTPTFKSLIWHEAMNTSAQFFAKEMQQAWVAGNRHDVWKAGLDMHPANDHGLILEFGVWRGESLNWLADYVGEGGRVVFGFDSFEGLSEDWAGMMPRGNFALSELPQVLPNAHLIVGQAQDTLPLFLKEHPEAVRLVHFDMDTYASTLDVLRLLAPRLAKGSIIVFDEFFGYPAWQQGEAKAWWDFVAEFRVNFRYFATTGMSVGIELIE